MSDPVDLTITRLRGLFGEENIVRIQASDGPAMVVQIDLSMADFAALLLGQQTVTAALTMGEEAVSEMRDRIAEIICVSLWGQEAWDRSIANDMTAPKGMRYLAEECRDAADGVLSAMREPTEAMLSAAIAPYRHGNTDEFNDILRRTVTKYLSDMLDEALK